jgi:peptidoglycan/LPS O-acetylase OafA/YrhL
LPISIATATLISPRFSCAGSYEYGRSIFYTRYIDVAHLAGITDPASSRRVNGTVGMEVGETGCSFLWGVRWQLDSPQVSEIGILWTICVEEQFYFALPFVLMWVVRFRWQYLIILLAVAATASSIIFFSRLGLSPPISSPYYQTTTYISTFAFGGVAALMLHRRQTTNELANPLLLFACIVVLIIVLSKNPDFWSGPYSLRAVTLYQIVPAMLAFIIWWVARHSGASFLLFLRSKLVRSIGILSYGIYLTHVISHRFVNLEGYLLGLPPSALTYYLLFIQYAAIAVFLAALTHGVVERPFLSIRKQLLPSKGSAIDARWNVNWRQVAIIAGGLSTLCLFALSLVSVAA